MTFISYAQNYEDVILWRALRDIEHGFYVDVGAADPLEDSVTNAFYERGWSGINIEPLHEYFQKLSGARPRDININAAVAHESGLRIMYAFPATGLSTLDPEVAARHKVAGRQTSETVVPVLTLKTILENYAPPTIHFLKIDVEGAEIETLKGLDLNSVRPWIIVIEATAPNLQVVTRENWEHLIIDHGYSFAYFDGLNCFYVADEVNALKERLAVPPNFFDNFMRYPEWSIRKEAAELKQEAEELKQETAGVRGHVEGLEAALRGEQARTMKLRGMLQIAQEQTANLRNSLEGRLDCLSGRIRALEVQLTAPSVDRAVGRTLRRVRQIGDRFTGGGIRSLARRVLATSAQVSMVNRCMISLSRTVLKPFPRVATAVQAFATEPVVAATRAEVLPSEVPSKENLLSASAQCIYPKLKSAMSGRAGWRQA